MVTTHCLPSGALGTGELAVPNVAKTVTVSDPGAGNRRGVVVFIHGIGVASVPVIPQPVPSLSPTAIASLKTAVVADGWAFVYVSVPEDFYQGGNNITGVLADISNDSGHGARQLASTLHLWDHIQTDLIVPTWGVGRPVIVVGQSYGGLKALQIVKNNPVAPAPCNLVGYIAHIPVGIMEALDSFGYGSQDWSGIDLSPTFMNGITIPGIIGYGTADTLLGWAATMVAAGSNGVDVSTFAGSGTLHVASSANLTVGPNVLVTGLTGGAGKAVVRFTGTGAGTLTGCTTIAGSGTLVTGNPCSQNFTDQIITNNSTHITRNATTDTHEWLDADSTTYAAWIASTLDGSYPVSF